MKTLEHYICGYCVKCQEEKYQISEYKHLEKYLYLIQISGKKRKQYKNHVGR